MKSRTKSRLSRERNKAPEKSATLSVRIQPRASKNGVSVMEDGNLKIRLTAPPVDGAANEALVKFLAETFSVPKSQVEILAGHTAKNKIVKIEGIGQEESERVLIQAEK